jgi:hypothetical protein
MCLQKKGMLVALSIGVWAARKRDKEAGAEVCERKGADSEAGVFTKRLVERAKLSPVTTIHSRARALVYRYALPWLDSGVHLLPADLFFKFDTEMQALKRAHDEAVAEFLEEYDELVGKARYRMAGLFDPSDYPSREEVERKYRFEVSYMPLPESGDFRVDAAKADIAELQKRYEAQAKKREAELSGEIAKRVAEAVSNFAAKLQPGKVYRDGAGRELAELAEVIYGLNLTGDKRIDELAAGVKALAKVNVADIREDKVERGKVVGQADELRKKANQVGGWF